MPLAIAVRDANYEVHVASPIGDPINEIKRYGFVHHHLPIKRSNLNLFHNIYAVYALIRLLLYLRPALVHLVTIKPVLYGGLATRLTGTPAVVAAVSGLGYVFTSHTLKARTLRRAVQVLYGLALSKKNLRVIFQNPEDRNTLLQLGVISADKSVIISGSGVDLAQYKYEREPHGTPIVTFASRLLYDKGVSEFVEAARILKQHGMNARFWLVGDIDQESPTAVTSEDLEFWREAGWVEILGYRQDISRIITSSNLVVLPSYYGEGLPKVLIEAAACGRAVVTTDHPGCRHAIEPGVTGLTVPVRDAHSLAKAIRELLENPDRRKKMGQAGRQLAEREYSIEKVVAEHLAIYEELLRHS